MNESKPTMEEIKINAEKMMEDHPNQIQVVGEYDSSLPMLVMEVNFKERYVSSDTVKAIAEMAKLMKEIYGDRYNIFITTDGCKILGPNVVQLNISPNNNFDDILQKLDIYAKFMKEGNNDTSAS